MNLPCRNIDIAKVEFNVCLLQLSGKLKHNVFPDHAAGFAQLQERSAKHEVPQVPAWKLPVLSHSLPLRTRHVGTKEFLISTFG